MLDYAALMPGERASDFIRNTARDLGISPESGVTIRLTGLVPMADEEFGNIADGAGRNALVTALIVLFIVWCALRSGRIVLAVGLSVVAGLAATAAVGLMMVGALNLISVAFAVLFVGIGVDFGIQFSVRYRAERYKEARLDKALAQAAAKAGRPLALAAAATAAGFYSFLPTDYRGVSELGLIAGTGMFIAFFSAITVLPALLSVLRPPPEQEPVGYHFLAPADRFMTKHRYAIVVGTLLVALAGTPLLRHLHFDFNPLNLRSPKVESVATLLDLMKDPDTDTNTIDVLAPSLADAPPLIARLQHLPEVARVTSLESFIPQDQDEKLAIIAPLAKSLAPLLDPAREKEPPTDLQDVEEMERAAAAFEATAAGLTGKGADDARRLAGLLRKMAEAPPQIRDAAREALIPGLDTMLDLLRASLTARKVTTASIPPDLARNWVSADGRARIEVAPSGDANDNDTLLRVCQGGAHDRPQRHGRAHRRSGIRRYSCPGVHRGGALGAAFDQRAALHRAAEGDRRIVDSGSLAACRRRHARNHGPDRPAAEFCEYHRATAFARSRGRLQDLFRDGVAGGDRESSAIEPHARGFFQRDDDRDRLRQPVDVQASGHLQHGQAACLVACLHIGGGDFVPAGANGAAEEGQFDGRGGLNGPRGGR